MSSSNLQLVTTKDGSQTILNEELGSTYHSRHGALTESKHVFIDKGLRKLLEGQVTDITLLEMGFGSGLNALLTFKLSREKKENINFEKFIKCLKDMSYSSLFADGNSKKFSF